MTEKKNYIFKVTIKNQLRGRIRIDFGFWLDLYLIYTANIDSIFFMAAKRNRQQVEK